MVLEIYFQSTTVEHQSSKKAKSFLFLGQGHTCPFCPSIINLDRKKGREKHRWLTGEKKVDGFSI